jgi:DNA-binding NarL/FixJ family response regulator
MSSTPSPIQILIADDHPSTRAGIRTMLEQQECMRVVAEAGDGEEAVARFREHQPDVVLMDLQMPKMDGLRAIAAIHAARPNAPIVVLTTYAGDARVSRALSAGAISYILKTAHRTQIIAAIFGALKGETVLDETVASELAANVGHESLSLREIGALRLVAQGKRNSDIGRALNVSEHTIKARMKNILAKLNANDRTHAVSIAWARGFIEH